MEQEREEDIVQKSERIARDYFKQGLNCTECVLRTYLDLHDTEFPPEILALAGGFGGGIGYTRRNTCGAVTGAVMALGAAIGRKDPFAKETPKERIQELKEIYPTFDQLLTELEETYGTVNCQELSVPHGDFEGKERKKSCMQIIGHCAAKVAEYVEKAEEAKQASAE